MAQVKSRTSTVVPQGSAVNFSIIEDHLLQIEKKKVALKHSNREADKELKNTQTMVIAIQKEELTNNKEDIFNLQQSMFILEEQPREVKLSLEQA